MLSCVQVIEFDDGSGSVLRIQPLRSHRDEATYECTATNSVGEINTSAKLTVLEGEIVHLRHVLANLFAQFENDLQWYVKQKDNIINGGPEKVFLPQSSVHLKRTLICVLTLFWTISAITGTLILTKTDS